MQFNIFSMQRLRTTDFILVFNEIPSKVIIKKRLLDGGLEQVDLMIESLQGRLTLDCTILSHLSPLPSIRIADALSSSLSMDLLHRRLGHSGQAALQRLLHDNMATSVSIILDTSVNPCDSCQLGKLT